MATNAWYGRQVQWNMHCKKLDMDSGTAPRIRGCMDLEIDDLVAGLCTRIGMLMEDASVDALTIGAISVDERKEALWRIDNAIRHMQTIVAAARALVGYAAGQLPAAEPSE